MFHPLSPPCLTATQPPSTHLLPSDKHDQAALDHIASLPPTEWSSLMLTPPESPPSRSRNSPAIDCSDGLLSRLMDINWPTALPVAQVLLTLLNGSRETREGRGKVLVGATRRVLNESLEWDWVYYCLRHLVIGIVDREWAREAFEGGLRDLGKGVGEWGIGDVVW
ncbi:hypothetical protein EK21DRAFT_53374 [Setomelanomma holmii]|uniref:Uncharacterized protein n=1 Tax=Setomelanomma holmii TaxID=210430 RepID=A0A9P4HLW2_9PLEO|nr:hypothetical protein EK21DRAFT_53374 [Setomelanomma holmii]